MCGIHVPTGGTPVPFVRLANEAFGYFEPVGEHACGLVLVEQLQPHEQPQHGAAKRLGQPRGIVHRPRHGGAIWPEPAVGDEEMQMRMPIRAQPCVSKHATIRTARSRSPVSVRMAAVTVRAATRAILPSRRRRYRQEARSRLGMVSTTYQCGTGASNVVSSHCVQTATRVA